MLSFTGARLERAQASPQFRNGRFSNSSGASPRIDGTSLSLMGDLLFGGKKRRPARPLPVESPLATWAKPLSSGLRVTWFGHSTLLLESGGVRALLDPVFGDYASPGFYAGRKRFHPVPATIAQLPPLDVSPAVARSLRSPEQPVDPRARTNFASLSSPHSASVHDSRRSVSSRR
jgi:hypothetical protein